MINITMRQMLEAGVHFGHKTAFWNPDMAPYIFGARQKLHIINLEKTLPMFRQALGVVDDVAKSRGKVLFVGTKFAARDVVRDEAIRCGMPYVDYRWLGGMMTNYKTIRVSIKRLKELERLFEQAQIVGHTKKEVLNLMREKDKLSLSLSGIKNMGGLPDAIFVIDVNVEKIAVKEAKRLGIPVIGVVDTNSSPDDIDYIIPGNDDAMRSIRFYCRAVADTIIEARGVLKLTDDALKAEKAKIEAAKKATVKTKVTPKVVAKKEELVAADDTPPVKKVVKKKTVKAVSTEAEKPAEKKVAAKKPAVKKPAVKKPAVKKPAVKKTAAKKTVAKKPAVKKATAETPTEKKEAEDL